MPGKSQDSLRLIDGGLVSAPPESVDRAAQYSVLFGKWSVQVLKRSFFAGAFASLCLVVSSMGHASSAYADLFVDAGAVMFEPFGPSPVFNGKPFQISVNQSIPNSADVMSRLVDELRATGQLEQVILSKYGAQPPQRIEVKIGVAVPPDVAIAVVRALQSAGVVGVVLTSAGPGASGESRMVYLGSYVGTDQPPVSPGGLKELASSPVRLAEYLVAHPSTPRRVRTGNPGPSLTDLVGTFATDPAVGPGGLRLTCASDTRCVLQVVSGDGKSVVETRSFESVSKLRLFGPVEYALHYVNAKLSSPPKNPSADLMAARKSLGPLEDVSLNIEDCHDIGSREGEGYGAICRVQRSPWTRPTILYFGTLMAGCGDLFCRYMIFPMFRE